MAGLCAPLSTLRQYPHGYLRMTRGRCGSLLLHRDGLAPSTPCRSPGALRSTRRTDIPRIGGHVSKVPKGDLSKREVHYVSQVVSKNCRPKCPGSAVQHHQQATYHHSLANIPETRPPVIGSKQKRCCENQGIAVI